MSMNEFSDVFRINGKPPKTAVLVGIKEVRG